MSKGDKILNTIQKNAVKRIHPKSKFVTVDAECNIVNVWKERPKLIRDSETALREYTSGENEPELLVQIFELNVPLSNSPKLQEIR